MSEITFLSLAHGPWIKPRLYYRTLVGRKVVVVWRRTASLNVGEGKEGNQGGK